MNTPKCIVTHPGQSHRDEFIATAIILAHFPGIPVKRRDATQYDLADPHVLVLDQGGQHDPEQLNFDHHQLPRDADPTCSLTLVLQAFGELELAQELWPWLAHTEILDSKGPAAWARECGTSFDQLRGALSPVEGFMLRCFGAAQALRDGDWMHDFLSDLGTDLIAGLNEVDNRLKRLDRDTKLFTVKGREVLDLTAIRRDEQPTMGVETWCKRHRPGVAITVSQDDRGSGLTLYRRNDAPGVDLSRLEGHDAIVFAHKNGFIAKTRAMLVDPASLLELAID